MPIVVYNRKDEINEGGFLMRNCTTIKEYDE
ncbi:1,4-dihydroxy-2-naphthoyl-CoA synthase, partial [Enterococcus faecalis]